MFFKNVFIVGLVYIDVLYMLMFKEINECLQLMLDCLGICIDVFGDIVGIYVCCLWDVDMLVFDVVILVVCKVLEDVGIGVDKIGLLVNILVSCDYLELFIVSIVLGNLGVGDECMMFDVVNVCLVFINGMDIVVCMFECGEIDYVLIVDGEIVNLVYEKIFECMVLLGVIVDDFCNEMVVLILGCGVVVMVMVCIELVFDVLCYCGGVMCLVIEWNQLCCGNLDCMVIDICMLLIEGIKLVQKIFGVVCEVLGWVVDELDQFVIYQVSQLYIVVFIKNFGIDLKKVMIIFGEYGNIGLVLVLIVLSKFKQFGKLKKGDCIVLFGIGLGLNCLMVEVVW